MKWMKHMSDTWDDEKVAKLVGDGGMEGLARYAVLWRVREIIASQMKPGASTASVQYSVNRWSLLLSLRGSLVFSTLSTLAVTGLATVERHGSDIRVTMANLLKYRDDYQRKSGQTSDTNKDIEEEVDIEEEKEKTLVRDAAHAIDPDDAIYLAYPKHVGKRKAVEAIGRAIQRISKGEVSGQAMTPMDARRWIWKRVATYARSPAAKDEQFVPHPATWFNQSRYLDDDAEWQRGRSNGRTGNTHHATKADVTLGNARELLAELEADAGSVPGEGPDVPGDGAAGRCIEGNAGDVRG